MFLSLQLHKSMHKLKSITCHRRLRKAEKMCVCVCGRGVCTDPNPEISLPRTGIETHVHPEPPECRAQDSGGGSDLGCRHQNDPVSFSASLRHQPHPLACSLSDKSHSRDGNATDLPKDTARAWHAGCKPGHPCPCPPGARRPRAGHRARGTRTRGYGLAQESPAPKQNQHRSPVGARKGSGERTAAGCPKRGPSHPVQEGTETHSLINTKN